MASRPPRLIALLYLGTAHAALLFACFMAAWWPRSVAGFFYHSWMVAIVHLVTLGWITFSILGAIYIVAPLALRMEMPSRRLDYVAYAFAVVGLVGMVGHFWIEEFGGMAFSAAMVTCAILYMTFRIVRRVRDAQIHYGVKLHIVLACANIWLAASMGLLIAADKVWHFLPGFVLSNVFAHAHLAAIGWATMMVVGVAYRLLPMTFPSRMISGSSLNASAILLETGVLGLFVTLLFRSAWSVLFGLFIAAGLIVFGLHIVWIRHAPAPKPPGAPDVNFAALHAAAAGVSLIGATAIGLMLLVIPMTPFALHAAAAYGVLGLVGFLAQMVVAMEARWLPMRDRSLQAMVFAGWLVAVPALAGGLFLESAAFVSVGAWSLLAAVAIGTLDNAFVLLHVARQHPQGNQPEKNEVGKEERRHRRRAAEDALEQSRSGLA